ncbi:MAG: hypothetical protein HYR94_10405, partial [Chloroflexi bacterium]|nr:hypothetical protein [Chloroflexota bacterium]
KIIDFPQAIDPHLNSDAYAILKRDVERLCQYFARYGVVHDPSAWVDQLWGRYGEPAQDVALDEGSDEL